MKIYKRQISPIKYTPGVQGAFATLAPIEEDIWYDEEEETSIRECYQKEIEDGWTTLIFKERYICIGNLVKTN